MKKITFIGDITSDRSLLNAAYGRSADAYDFSPVFGKVKRLFEESDYVVDNFETVRAGGENGFRNQYLLCNFPDELIQAMVKGSISCVTTANNHYLNQGIRGLVHAIKELDRNKILHIGTFTYENASKRILYLYLNHIVVALIPNTYSIDSSSMGTTLDDRNDFHMNLLEKQNEFTLVGKRRWAKRIFFRFVKAGYRRRIDRVVARMQLRWGKVFLKPGIDVIMDGDTDNKYLGLLVEDLKTAREKTDYVIVCSHIRGQFSEAPGTYSRFMADFVLEHGADMLIGNHPYVIQETRIENKRVVVYSLDSFNQSPSADYIIHDTLPEYSMALHVYFSKDRDRGNVRMITSPILKAVEDSNKMIVVYPIDELSDELEEDDRIQLQGDVKRVYERITGTPILKGVIRREYVLR